MKAIYDIERYNYDLPEECIAQEPAARRDASRLLVLDCKTDELSDKHFSDVLDYFKAGDVIVVNDTRVFPARLLGRKPSGGKVELLVLEYPAATGGQADESNSSWAEVTVTGLIKSSKRPKPGGRLLFGPQLEGIVQELRPDGKARVLIRYQGDLSRLLEEYGIMPLPPYIRRHMGEKTEDRQRYQTVFAKQAGAVAAPTAGLHFTDALLKKIQGKGVDIAVITLHVGYGTFAPVRVDDIREHRIHSEYLEISAQTAGLVNEAKASRGTVWAVGTTTVRALEYAADEQGRVCEKSGQCDLYIYPGYKFRVVDNLITNFHLPRSSLLFLVSALAGQERILRAYDHAIKKGYRFYSYGDAMAIIT